MTKRVILSVFVALMLLAGGGSAVAAQQVTDCTLGGRGFAATEMRGGPIILEFVGFSCPDEDTAEELFDLAEDTYADIYADGLTEKGAEVEPFEEVDDVPDIGDEQVAFETTADLDGTPAEIVVVITRVETSVLIVVAFGDHDTLEGTLDITEEHVQDVDPDDDLMDQLPEELDGFTLEQEQDESEIA